MPSLDLHADVRLNPITIITRPTRSDTHRHAWEPENRGVVALLCSRRGLSTKHGLALANSVGVIDSDYRGEILVSIIKNGSLPYSIESMSELLSSCLCRYSTPK